MPNYVANVLEMKNIRNLPLFTKKDGRKCFDFNKIIPMPECLNLESGTHEEWAITYYLTERCRVPVSCLLPETKKLLEKLVSNMFNKDYAQVIFNRTFEAAYKMSEQNKDKMYTDGMAYIDNYKTYGATTWYDWRRNNWGTKWNAMDSILVNDNIVAFQTAWSAPIRVIEKLSVMYPDLEIKLSWADEGYGTNTGSVVHKNGRCISGGANENRSPEAYETYDYCWDI